MAVVPVVPAVPEVSGNGHKALMPRAVWRKGVIRMAAVVVEEPELMLERIDIGGSLSMGDLVECTACVGCAGCAGCA